MPVTAIGDYPALPRDKVENFHGNIFVVVGWDHHLMVSSPMAFPLPPDMPFGALVKEVVPAAYGADPDFGKINWETAKWTLDGAPFTPDMEKSLKENGVGHKSVLRFETPDVPNSLFPN